MIINRTADFIHYYHPVNTSLDRSPRFLRRAPSENRGIDTIDISPEARELLRERNDSSLMRAGFRLSLAIGELMMMAERTTDMERRQKVQDLRNRVRNGSYDFNSAEAISAAGSAVAGRMDRA